jgi:hypothetical protein
MKLKIYFKYILSIPLKKWQENKCILYYIRSAITIAGLVLNKGEPQKVM